MGLVKWNPTRIACHIQKLQRLIAFASIAVYLLKIWKWFNKRRLSQRLKLIGLRQSEGWQLWNSFRNDEARRSLPQHVGSAKIQHVSIAGGGAKTISYVGQMHLLRKSGAIDSDTHFYGTSIGAAHAALMALDCAGYPIWETVAPRALDYCVQLRRHPILMWGLVRMIFRFLMNHAFPEDISAINGKVHICVTFLFPYPHLRVISEFDNKIDLIECIAASMHVPGWTRGWLPFTTYRGNLCMDGGFFQNEPIPHTATRRPNAFYQSDLFPSACNLKAIASTLSGKGEELHFKVKDHVAPLHQIFLPPPVEDFPAEIERGWQDAKAELQKFSKAVNAG
jgi:hypothetical protein